MLHIIISIIIRVIFWGCILSLIIMAIKSVKEDKIREEKKERNTNKRVYHWSVEYPTPYEQLCNDIDDMIASAWTYPINYKYTEKQNKIENENVMRKSDLRSGDIVEIRNGEKYIVLLNSYINGIQTMDVILNLHDMLDSPLSEYCDNLEHRYNSNYDITKVCHEKNISKNFGYHVKNSRPEHWTWERDEKKEMTISEIEKELGYEIKVVKE